MIEEWKDIEGYERLYQVSNLGRVKSLERTRTIRIPEKILSLSSIDAYGYNVVCLSKDGVQKSLTIHRLVGSAFIPNPNNYPCINHSDEIKTNNKSNNLEWCSYEENNNHGTRNNRISNTLKVTNQRKRRLR